MNDIFAKIGELLQSVNDMAVELSDAKESAAHMEKGWREAVELCVKKEHELASLKDAYDSLKEQYKSLAEERNSLRAQYASLKSKYGA